MKEGSVYIVVSFPKSFPAGIIAETEIFSSPIENVTFRINAFPDGHLLILVQDHHHIYSRFESQRIRFQFDRDRIISFIWSETNISLKINNIIINHNLSDEILLVSDDGSIQKTKAVKTNSNIEKWINWRNERFSKNYRSVIRGRRGKTEAEQVNELVDVVRNLEHTFKEWLTGKDYLTMSLLSLLRSLVCHRLFEKDPKLITYNPLLFRVASFKGLPLPIYARPVNLEIPREILDLSENNLFHVIVNEATPFKSSNSQILMDLQEWVNGEVIITFMNKLPCYYSINDVLRESSNTIGGSHFDPDIPFKIDLLMNIKSLEVDLIKKIVTNTVQICIFKCKHVLSHFKVG